MALEKILKNSSGVPTGEYERIAGGTLYADTPVGVIQSFGGSAIPTGWLLCDGAEKNKTDYPELYAVIGDAFGTASVNTKFVLPDLREATTKGVGLTGKSNNHYDSDGVALGEFIDDRVQNHQHGVYIEGNTGYPAAFKVNSGSNGYNINNTSGVTNGSSAPLKAMTITSGRSGATTEVKAVGVNYIIKAKMVALPADLESAVEDAVEEMCTDTVTSGSTAPITSGGVYDELYNQTVTKKVVSLNSTVVDGSTQYANNVGRIQGHNAISTVKNPTTGRQWPVTNSNSNDTFVALEDVQIYVDKANYKIYMRAANSTDMGEWFALN